MIWNKSKECMSRDELANLQGKHLVKLVKYMYQNVAYYKEKCGNWAWNLEIYAGLKIWGNFLSPQGKI